MSNQKIYVNGMVIRKRTTAHGDIIKLSIKADELKSFLDEHADNGWVRIDLLERREVSEKGATHYAALDTWQPDRPSQGGGTRAEKSQPQRKTPEADDGFFDTEDEDVPF